MQLKQNEKVQFFDSQSSFGGSSALSMSRVQTLNDQIVSQYESIFALLKRVLVPYEYQVSKENLSIINNRAKILENSTINHQLEQLKRYNQPTKQLKQIQKKVQQYLKDYQDYQTSHLTYKQFYNKYCQKSNSFSKKNNAYIQQFQGIPIHTDIVQIVQNKNINTNLSSNTFALNQSRMTKQNNNYTKQIHQLRQQINNLVKRQKVLKKQMQVSVYNEKMSAEQRIKKILSLRWNLTKINYSEQFQLAKRQLFETKQKLMKEYDNVNLKQKKIKELENKLIQSNNQKRGYLQQIQTHRKLENSRISDNFSQGNKTIRTQFDAPNDLKKLQKAVKTLTMEKNLLKNQLAKQRQLNYNIKASINEDTNSELLSIRKQLQKVKREYSQLKYKCDRIEVEYIFMKNNQQSKDRDLIQLRKQNQTLIKIQREDFPMKASKQFKLMAPINNIDRQKPFIQSYDGQGIQGYPYYDLLTRQFKIRFRRSCLKQKQLLYKSNGIEIGVIAERIQPNEIKLLLHITNYSDQIIRNVNFKVINSSANKTNIENQHIVELKVGEQHKIPVYCIVKEYPLGAFILVLDLKNRDIKQQLRILLPMHIFKLSIHSNRTQKLIRPQQTHIRTVDKKIIKDFKMLESYFKNCNGVDNKLKLLVDHPHAESKTSMDLILNNQQLTIKYQNIKGDQKITEYYIKTLKFIFAK